ncbi:hypothetical protein [Microbulbifer aggregans]|uniref:hypothetical protein n=1 Tax=Microbulbifer aggregans TaxID=1769779 RepID=UPI001CFCA013|nr:hypothetical protein [Microbulbifer aggregans]
MKKLLIIGLSIFVVACASSKNQNYVKHVERTANVSPGSILLVKVKSDAPVEFYGETDLDDVNADHGSMMYVANTPGVFAASVLAHALIADSANDSKKAKAQEEADKILVPYASAIEGMKEEGLILAALGSSSFSAYEFSPWNENSDSEWIITAKPVFVMSQDQHTLTLKNAITLTTKDSPEAPAYQNLIEVVSISGDTAPALAEEDLVKTASDLLVTSFSILEAELQGLHAEKNKQQTLSYLHGGKKKFERGVVLSEQCDRLTFRSLRGWIKSVPAGSGNCDTVSQESEIPGQS